jgi:hypothetical protein
MSRFADPVLITLVGLLLASLSAFFVGLFPYPYGLMVLGAFITARILFLIGTTRSKG